MEKERVQEIAFQLISFAGDAYSSFLQAVESAREGDFDAAQERMTSGKEMLKEAHNVQTDLLTAEAQGNDPAYSIIMVHAQDHLMNAILFEQVANELIYLHKERKAG